MTEKHPQSEDTEDLATELIMSHKIIRSSLNSQAAYVKPLYRIFWYDHGPFFDTWEPTAHLQRNKIFSDDMKRKLKLPDNIDDDIDGKKSEEQLLAYS